MIIIGICGSPRKNGNTEILLKEALKGAEELGTKTELILLRMKKIEFCKGCEEVCEKTGSCQINDDMMEIYDKIGKSDGIIIGTPTYFNMISGVLKNFIDRCLPMSWSGRLKNKVTGIIAVGGDGDESIKEAAENIKTFIEICEMKNIGKPLCIKASKCGEIAKNDKALTDARNLGVKIVKSIVGK